MTGRKVATYLFQFNFQSGNTFYLPYSVGMLWAYASQTEAVRLHFEKPCFVFMKDDPKAIVSRVVAPDIAAFSTYVWNWEISVRTAELLKQRAGGTLTAECRCAVRSRWVGSVGWSTGVSRYGAGDVLAVPAITKAGRTISIEFTIQMLRDASGELVGPLAVIRDVTKRFERERELARRVKDLEIFLVWPCGRAKRANRARAIPPSIGKQSVERWLLGCRNPFNCDSMEISRRHRAYDFREQLHVLANPVSFTKEQYRALRQSRGDILRGT